MSKAIKYTATDTLTAAIALDGAEAARERFAASMLATAGDIARDLGPLLAKGQGRPGKSAPEVMRAQWIEQYSAGTGCKRPSAVTAVNRLIHCAVIVDKHAGRVKGDREAWVLKVRQAVKAGTADDAAALAAKYVADPVAFVNGRAASTQKGQTGANVGPNGADNQTAATPGAAGKATGKGKGKGKGSQATPDAGQGTPDAGQGGQREIDPIKPVPTDTAALQALEAFLKDRRDGSDNANPFRLTDSEESTLRAMIKAASAALALSQANAAKAAAKGGKAS